MNICGVISNSGPNQEPLACAYEPGHTSGHSWGTLPTFVNGQPVGRATGTADGEMPGCALCDGLPGHMGCPTCHGTGWLPSLSVAGGRS